ncbi:hypothetical protein PSCLAVI8L_150235 [Pseudoclavibacter sp. 8L]|nr:hypothetical protein PSCLAVI8L_150235 [Pseudoclavibacter sp. 8L]
MRKSGSALPSRSPLWISCPCWLCQGSRRVSTRGSVRESAGIVRVTRYFTFGYHGHAKSSKTILNRCLSASGGLSERPMELVLKTSGQQCLVGSNPTPSATNTLT